MQPITLEQLKTLDPVAAKALVEELGEIPTILLHDDGSFSCHDLRGDVYEWDVLDAQWFFMGDD